MEENSLLDMLLLQSNNVKQEINWNLVAASLQNVARFEIELGKATGRGLSDIKCTSVSKWQGEGKTESELWVSTAGCQVQDELLCNSRRECHGSDNFQRVLLKKVRMNIEYPCKGLEKGVRMMKSKYWGQLSPCGCLPWQWWNAIYNVYINLVVDSYWASPLSLNPPIPCLIKLYIPHHPLVSL